MKELVLPKQCLDYKHLCKKYTYLRGLPVDSYLAAAPKVLILLNNINIITSKTIKEGRRNEPIAQKSTRLDSIWAVC